MQSTIYRALLTIFLATCTSLASANEYALNSSFLLTTTTEKQSDTNEFKYSILTNHTFGILTGEGYLAGGKFLYHRSKSESSDGLDNLTDTLASLGGSVGYVGKGGLSALGSLLILPTRTLDSSATFTYYGGMGFMLDLGYTVSMGKNALGFQYSLGQIRFENRTSGHNDEENLEGDHTIFLAQPYISLWMFL